MKLSTRGRYGIILMLDLALHYGEGPIHLKDIAKRQGLSAKYLWQLINSLSISGLIDTARGKSGGYVLAKSPSEISMKDIIHVVEGPLIVDCANEPPICEQPLIRVTNDIWHEVSNSFSQILEKITLADMMERQKIIKQ